MSPFCVQFQRYSVAISFENFYFYRTRVVVYMLVTGNGSLEKKHLHHSLAQLEFRTLIVQIWFAL